MKKHFILGSDKKTLNRRNVKAFERILKAEFNSEEWVHDGAVGNAAQLSFLGSFSKPSALGDKLENLAEELGGFSDEGFSGPSGNNEYTVKLITDYWTYIFDIVSLEVQETVCYFEIIYTGMTIEEMEEDY